MLTLYWALSTPSLKLSSRPSAKLRESSLMWSFRQVRNHPVFWRADLALVHRGSINGYLSCMYHVSLYIQHARSFFPLCYLGICIEESPFWKMFSRSKYCN
jgi:hypothetical protein